MLKKSDERHEFVECVRKLAPEHLNRVRQLMQLMPQDANLAQTTNTTMGYVVVIVVKTLTH